MHIRMLADFTYPVDETGNVKRTLMAGHQYDEPEEIALRAVEEGAAFPYGDELPEWAKVLVGRPAGVPSPEFVRLAGEIEAAARERADLVLERDANIDLAAARLREIEELQSSLSAAEAALAATRAELEAATSPSGDGNAAPESERPTDGEQAAEGDTAGRRRRAS
ncbi:hypothetical protein MMB17_07470 [Methylobacterium organophilum]|uniref:hypothetical protein n=1 Tax=Methylobacterium organophilum TaxID=410 RepID=UPI001F1442F1|nr:hypothetical protein [Methylobacterium organophilum]UMY19129.1 hypothetical protein MMB17_07470 [Methylobacterium organophilum]